MQSLEDASARLQASVTTIDASMLRRVREIAVRRTANGRRPLRTPIATTRCL
jgi:hypothetical protein